MSSVFLKNRLCHLKLLKSDNIVYLKHVAYYDQHEF